MLSVREIDQSELINSHKIYCNTCDCFILKAGLAETTKLEQLLPNMTNGTEESVEFYWKLTDMMKFENVGFSRSKDGGVKYLLCADCERGPIGFQAGPALFYIAADRVRYKS